MYRGQVPHIRPTQGANVVALESDLHPLIGLRSAYYICMREPLEEIASPLRRFFIRLVYFKWDWYSGHSVHDQGIFTDRDVAEDIAKQKRAETGRAWSVKELPVNGLLCDGAVQYGFYSYPGSAKDAKYQNRKTKFVAVDSDVKALIETKLGELEECIEGKCARVL